MHQSRHPPLLCRTSWLATGAILLMCAACRNQAAASAHEPLPDHEAASRRRAAEARVATPELPLQWQYQSASPLSGPPVLSGAGQIVFNTLEGYVHSLTSEGALSWSFTTVGPPLGSPASDERGRVYVVTQAGHIHAIEPTGTAAFAYRVPVRITSPGVWTDRAYLVFAGSDQHLWAYSPRAGLLWRLQLAAPVTQAPLVLAPGELVLATEGEGVWRVRGRKLVERLWPDQDRVNALALRDGVITAHSQSGALLSAVVAPPTAPATVRYAALSSGEIEVLTASDPPCRVRVLSRPLAGAMPLADRVLVWTQHGQLAAISQQNLAVACRSSR